MRKKKLGHILGFGRGRFDGFTLGLPEAWSLVIGEILGKPIKGEDSEAIGRSQKGTKANERLRQMGETLSFSQQSP